MSFSKVWVHVVWTTKKRAPLLRGEHCETVCRHIRSNAVAKGFYITAINGYLDHIHCLMALRTEWSVARQVQMIKGEAASWANKNRILPWKLEWAEGYFAASVSESRMEVVRRYILNQRAHHGEVSFEEEYQGFLRSLRGY